MKSFLFITMVCLLGFLLAAASAVQDDPVPGPIDEHTYGTYFVDGQFSFAGVFNSDDFKTKQDLYAKLTPKAALPEGFTLDAITITFRRWPCNCYIQQFTIDKLSEDVKLTFTEPIDDDAMSFQAVGTYKGTTTTTIDFTLAFSASAEHTADHAMDFSIEPRESFANVLSFSGARDTIAGLEFPAARWDMLLSGINWEKASAPYPTLRLTAVGRFQFRYEAGKTVATRCYINGIGLPGEISGTSEFHTWVSLDLLQYPPWGGKLEFMSIHCDTAGALVATNAPQAFKYDNSFLTIEYYNEASKPTGFGQYGTFQNFPDVYPTTFTAAGYIDEDVLYCKYSVNFGQNDKKDDVNEENLKHSDAHLSVFFSGLQNVKKDEASVRIDVTRNVYNEDSALNYPFKSDLVPIANQTINALSAEFLNFQVARFHNLTGGLSFSTFVDLNKLENVEAKAVQCAGIMYHGNDNNDWPGTSKYTAASTVTTFKPFAAGLSSKTVLVKEKANFEFVIEKMNLDTTIPVTKVDVNLDLMQNWILDGNFTTCRLSNISSDAFVIPAKPITPKDRESGATALSFNIGSKPTQALFEKDKSVQFECPDVKFVSKNPQYEFAHESTLIQVKVTQSDEDTLPIVTSHSLVLHLDPNPKYAKIVFIAFAVIMTISALGMLICMARCVFATCTRKKEEDESLLLNSNANSYTLE